MEDENSSTSKNYPSLPPNYVTLVQLQERWVEQQQRKQREKEEEVERKQREKEEEEERKQREEHERRNENGERSEANAFPRPPRRRQPFRKNSWIQSEKRSSSAGKSEESHIGAIVVNDGESKIDVSNKKKKNKNKSKKKQRRNWEKPRAEQNLIPGMEKAENEDEVEKTPVVSTEKDCELQGDDKNLVENGVAMGKRAAGNRSVGIGRKFAERGGNDRDASNVRGGQWKVAKIPVVPTERGCELQRNGKKLVVNGVDLEKKVPVEQSVGIGELSASGGGRGGNERDGRKLHGGLRKVEKIPMVSTERDCELLRNGKNLVVNGVDLDKKVPVERLVGIGQKFEELSVSGGGRGGNERNGRNVRGGQQKVEKIPVVSTERDCELQGNGKDLVVNGMDLEKKVLVERSVGIGRKFEELSVSGGEGGGNERDGRNVHGGQQKVERIPVVSTERDWELQGNGKNLVVNGVDLEKKAAVERSVEIGRKFEEFSVGGGRGGNERGARNVQGSQWKYSGSSWRFNSGRPPQRPRDSNLVWVRKGDDASDASVAGV